ncbi:MAG TPA: HlyD family efflux transporter periplasmic adaptor subunit, partial [Saprospiraceae bacterium]|nr:HlyD family efflux transporter periplasmic adaptor subunit [Saprospiraceae bacterium]
LYKIANLDTLVVRAYISEQQLNQLKIGQQIKVTVYQGDDQNKNYDGVLVWVSDKAEFTPKTIMTADERANLVYAIKIKVPNDGFLKIGMYADVNW